MASRPFVVLCVAALPLASSHDNVQPGAEALQRYTYWESRSADGACSLSSPQSCRQSSSSKPPASLVS